MEARSLPLSDIYVMDGFNPRRHFDEGKLNELAEDIKHRGMLQPIVVRPEKSEQGEFHLVAGERRFRAAKLAGLREVLTVVRDCSIDEARQMAIAENEKREGVSAGEEAVAAQKVLDSLEGDRAQAAKELGWSRSKLDSRLLLLHAVDEVIDALSQGKIRIGHAELLAGLPSETQAGTLAKVIADNVSVSDLSARVKSFAIPLSTAVFDLAGCNGCPHNSSSQLGLFDSAIGEAMCQNRTCFAEKTSAALAEKKEALKSDFNVVILATEKPDSECTPLMKEGSAGVGRTQFSACQQCAHFGARIEDRLNGKTGEVVEGMCFNKKCNTEKVAAYQASLAEASAPQDSEGASADAAVKTKTPASSAGKKEKAAVADLPKGAKVAISKQVRARMPELVRDNRSLQLALIIDALSHYIGRSFDGLKGVEGIPDKLAHHAGSGSRVDVEALAGFEPEALEKVILVLVSALPARDSIGNPFDGTGWADDQLKRAVKMAKAVGKNEGEVFEIDADFLAALPKAAIQSVLEEVGFREWFLSQEGENREKDYKALLAKKKADLPAAIMEAGFDWKGRLPAQVEGFLGGK